MTNITCVVYDLIDCATPNPQPNDLLAALHAAVTRLGARILAELPVQFPHHGITCALILAESHLVLSTWPEHRLATIDLSTCRADTTPHHALQPAFQLFQPREIHSQFIDRTAAQTSGQV